VLRCGLSITPRISPTLSSRPEPIIANAMIGGVEGTLCFLCSKKLAEIEWQWTAGCPILNTAFFATFSIGILTYWLEISWVAWVRAHLCFLLIVRNSSCAEP
jgi:hypothetical protein